MASSIVAVNVICPAGVTVSQGSVANINVGPGLVVAIRWRIPPGPQGFLEWFIAQSGVPIYPTNRLSGVIGDNEWDTWPISLASSNPVWQVFANNTGTKNHVVELQFYMESGGGSTGPPVDLTAIFPQNDLEIPTMFLT